MFLVKQRLAQLVSGCVTKSSCGGAVVGWVQVYYITPSPISFFLMVSKQYPECNFVALHLTPELTTFWGKPKIELTGL